MQSFVDKYKVMPIAGNNLNCSYTLLGSKLTVTIQGEKKKKNLGDIASSSVKTSAHLTAEVKKQILHCDTEIMG